MAKRKPKRSLRPEQLRPELEWATIDTLTLGKRNPRGSHRLAALAESIRRHGFGQPITINRTTGNVIAGKGRLRALRRMQRAREAVPGGIRTVAGAWCVPALVASWPSDREALLDLALNGGVDGSLEGDLDAAVVAEILKTVDEADRLALGLTEPQADQYQRDQDVAYVEPVINLEGLDRSESARSVDRQTTVRLIVPPELADRARALVKKRITAAQLLARGVDHLEGANAAKTKAKTKRQGGKRSTPPAAARPARRKGRASKADH